MEEFGLEWALAGIFLTAFVTSCFTWLITSYTLSRQEERETETRREERDRHGTYLAVRVSSILDPFVMSAVDVVNDQGTYDQQGEREPEEQTPTLTLPDDVDWKSIDPHLMDRILTLPNEIESAKKSMSFVAEVIAGPPDYEDWFEERRYQWGRIGILALDLATDLRKRYALKPRDYSRYDPRPHLEKAFREKDDMIKHGAEVAKTLIENHEKKKSGKT